MDQIGLSLWPWPSCFCLPLGLQKWPTHGSQPYPYPGIRARGRVGWGTSGRQEPWSLVEGSLGAASRKTQDVQCGRPRPQEDCGATVKALSPRTDFRKLQI